MDDAEIRRLIRESEGRVIKRVKEGVAYQRHAPQHRDGGSDIAGIVVEEADGTPSVKNVTRIKVSNTTLTDNSDGSVSLSVSAAGAGVSLGDNLVYIGTGADLTAGRSLAADTAHTVPVTGVDPNKIVTITAVAASTSVVGHAKFDSTTPAAVSTAGSAGTSAVIADRAHVHAHEAAHLAHDTLWDAAGDMVIGTGADTAARVAIGAANKVWLSDGSTAAWQYVEHEVSITIETPSAAEDIIIRKFKSAVTITAISAICVGGTSVTINPKHGTTTAGTDLLLTAPEVVASANTDGEQIGSTGTAMATTLSDVTLVAGEILRMVTTGISGTPTALHCTITYRLT